MNTGRAPDQGTEYETVTEVPAAGPVPMVTHPGWAERFPHLRQGTTVRRLPVVGRTKADAESGHEWASESRAGPDFDMGLFSSGERRDVEERWNLLARSTGFDRVVHGRQIHAIQVAVHTSVPTGPLTVQELRARIAQQPRIPLAHLPTPLDDCPRLTKALGGPRILVKRDDMTGLAFGGNKTRTLEYLFADIVASGADVIE